MANMTRLRFPPSMTVQDLQEEIANLTRITGLRIALWKPSGGKAYNSNAKLQTIRAEYKERSE